MPVTVMYKVLVHPPWHLPAKQLSKIRLIKFSSDLILHFYKKIIFGEKKFFSQSLFLGEAIRLHAKFDVIALFIQNFSGSHTFYRLRSLETYLFRKVLVSINQYTKKRRRTGNGFSPLLFPLDHS